MQLLLNLAIFVLFTVYEISRYRQRFETSCAIVRMRTLFMLEINNKDTGVCSCLDSRHSVLIGIKMTTKTN